MIFSVPRRVSFFEKPAKLVPTMCFILCFAGQASFSYAASVFKVSNGSHSTYIGGTLHLLSADDYPLPAAYQLAYDSATTLVFETDLDTLESAEFSRKMVTALTYSDGRTLADDLAPATLSRLSEHLHSRGLSLSRFTTFKASLMSITLSMIELQMMGLTSEGVDKYFFNQGKSDHKTISWLESPQEQLAFITQMGQGNEDAFIQYTLDDVATLPNLLPALKSSWKIGDLDALYNNSMSEFAAQYPDVFDTLLTDRNHNWMDFLVKSLATPEIEFVLVGALHLPGESGILSLLKQRGFTVEKL